MARHTVDLPCKSFKSKAEAKTYFREMLNRYQDGEDLKPNDDTILFELLQRHPEANEKIGVGVKRFYRDKSRIHPTSCFHIERTDGTPTDFSYVSCINEKAPTLAQQFYDACRYAVSEELTHQKDKLFREAGGIMRCTKTGAQITIDEAEYRHTEPKFREIVRDFIEENDITISSALVTHSSDMQYVARFSDLNIERLFKNYHATKSHLAMFKKYER